MFFSFLNVRTDVSASKHFTLEQKTNSTFCREYRFFKNIKLIVINKVIVILASAAHILKRKSQVPFYVG